MDYATEILKDPTYQSIVAEIEALEADRIYCRHGMAHIMDVCRLSWNLCLEDICLLQEFARNDLPEKFMEAEAETTNFPAEGANQTNLTVEFMETLRDRMFVVGLLHDIGRGVQYKTGEHHARAGARLADEILTRLRYPQEWKEQTVEIIRDHCGRKSKISKADAWSFPHVGRLIAYYIQRADHLSRLCFCCNAADTCKWAEDEKNQRFV